MTISKMKIQILKISKIFVRTLWKKKFFEIKVTSLTLLEYKDLNKEISHLLRQLFIL